MGLPTFAINAPVFRDASAKIQRKSFLQKFPAGFFGRKRGAAGCPRLAAYLGSVVPGRRRLRQAGFAVRGYANSYLKRQFQAAWGVSRGSAHKPCPNRSGASCPSLWPSAFFRNEFGTGPAVRKHISMPGLWARRNNRVP